MKRLFSADLCDREFGSACLDVASLQAWAAGKGLRLHTVPSLADFDLAQVEAILCAIERAARAITEADALAILRKRSIDERAALMAPVWWLAAEAHQRWRQVLTEAIAAGELQLLDPVSALPVVVDGALAEEAMRPVNLESVAWQEVARTLADTLDEKDAACGAWSSTKDMSDRISKELRRLGVTGKHGPVSGETVRREALGGILWNRKRGKGESGKLGNGEK